MIVREKVHSEGSVMIHGGTMLGKLLVSDDGKNASTCPHTNTPCTQSNRNPETVEDTNVVWIRCWQIWDGELPLVANDGMFCSHFGSLDVGSKNITHRSAWLRRGHPGFLEYHFFVLDSRNS